MAKGTCSIEGCGRNLKAYGWCNVHYQRWRKHGDPLVRKMIFGSVEERLNHYIDKRGPDECWPWTGALGRGYGIIWANGVSSRAYREAFKLWVGPVPAGAHLDHVCHDPSVCSLTVDCPHRSCCNPAHLKAVTPRANTMRSNAITAINARKTECYRGHPFDEANTAWRLRRRSNGQTYWARYCRTCFREQDRRNQRKRYALNRAAALSRSAR